MLTRTRNAAMASLLLSVTIVAVLMLGHAANPTLSLPDLSGSCTPANAAFSTALTADTLTGLTAWQVNVTYTVSQVKPMSYSFGSSFTGGVSVSKNNTGSYVLGYSFLNGASITAATATTLFTLNWKTSV